VVVVGLERALAGFLVALALRFALLLEPRFTFLLPLGLLLHGLLSFLTGGSS
jgi:hypothetical protein